MRVQWVNTYPQPAVLRGRSGPGYPQYKQRHTVELPAAADREAKTTVAATQLDGVKLVLSTTALDRVVLLALWTNIDEGCYCVVVVGESRVVRERARCTGLSLNQELG